MLPAGADGASDPRFPMDYMRFHRLLFFDEPIFSIKLTE
jgi:hypothetical protein